MGLHSRQGGVRAPAHAAAKVLEQAEEPLNCKAVVERALEASYWASDGKTPHATIYSRPSCATCRRRATSPASARKARM